MPTFTAESGFESESKKKPTARTTIADTDFKSRQVDGESEGNKTCDETCDQRRLPGSSISWLERQSGSNSSSGTASPDPTAVSGSYHAGSNKEKQMHDDAYGVSKRQARR